ncbi:MAG: serine--tRNA ligase [Candidatus Marinimicrobia bacterium]|nr:serine--tRNA ligase [Candidatus Neomarinimicrobiota bacterium]
MLSLKCIRENLSLVKSKTNIRNINIDFDKIIELDKSRRELITKSDDLKFEKNSFSKKIGIMKKNNENITEVLKSIKNNSDNIKELDDSIRLIDNEIENLLLYIPNVFHDSVPIGNSENDNVLIREYGKPREFKFTPKDHIELGTNLGLFDFKRATKMSGSGFPLYTGFGAKLERGIIQFMLDLHTEKHGYTELFPPFLTTRSATQTTGQLPKFEEDMYYIPSDDLFCISTAEVPVTNIHKDEILDEKDFPIKYVAYSACFRREAGSYGKDTRGLLRVHQFNKVEMVKFAHPDTSYNELDTLLGDAEKVLKLLNIPYRVIMLCTGDLSFSAAKCYDIEIWAPGTNQWLEVSSCSNFESFQAIRGDIKFRRSDTGKLDYVHTLNGSGVATPRLIASLIENNQNEDGSISIPEILQPYVKLEKINI